MDIDGDTARLFAAGYGSYRSSSVNQGKQSETELTFKLEVNDIRTFAFVRPDGT